MSSQDVRQEEKTGVADYWGRHHRLTITSPSTPKLSRVIVTSNVPACQHVS